MELLCELFSIVINYYFRAIVSSKLLSIKNSKSLAASFIADYDHFWPRSCFVDHVHCACRYDFVPNLLPVESLSFFAICCGYLPWSYCVNAHSFPWFHVEDVVFHQFLSVVACRHLSKLARFASFNATFDAVFYTFPEEMLLNFQMHPVATSVLQILMVPSHDIFLQS